MEEDADLGAWGVAQVHVKEPVMALVTSLCTFDYIVHLKSIISII